MDNTITLPAGPVITLELGAVGHTSDGRLAVKFLDAWIISSEAAATIGDSQVWDIYTAGGSILDGYTYGDAIATAKDWQ